MKSSELRERYLSFFESKGCKRVASSSLVPDDPSMLLTSAGMVQFKPYFLQQKQLEEPFVGTTTAQKCVRTTDIDIIGTTGRHLSFFEMLGNFSFGAYFKQEMCAWAYEFSTEVLGFEPERLYYTVYLDDDETIEVWKSLGVPEDRITRLGEKDNFWMAGPTGPCGPCSEIYYDQGPAFGCDSPDCGPGCDCDRYLEYWNCVFTQYDRQEDGTLVPLPKKNIDTGMGLERTAAILQGVQSTYETDILRGLIAVGEKLAHKRYGADAKDDLSMRICADHARAVTFMIADGILPANDGRGYVLRRLLRRAVRYGQLLGIEPPFLGDYVTAVIDEMGAPYPELRENQRLIERIIHAEEERFNQTLRSGQNYLDAHLSELIADKANATDASAPVLGGKAAFELHDRYGFPIDLTIEIAAERGVSVDRDGFERYMDDQRERARAAAKDDAWGSGSIFNDILNAHGPSTFVGYGAHEAPATVVALVVAAQEQADAGHREGREGHEGHKGAEDAGVSGGSGINASKNFGDGAASDPGETRFIMVDRIAAGQRAQVVLDRTPFYGEMGGQVGDTGFITISDGTGDFHVEDTKVYEKAVYAHSGVAGGTLAVGDTVVARIDSLRRERIERNHTATHLLHLALRTILGEHVRQAGSLVAPDHLRFDFTHFEAVTPEQIRRVEELVNNLVMKDSNVSAYETSLDEARASGVTALFGEKYGERVRVLEAGADSRELCGGTHVTHTAQIGFLKVTGESSVGANLRRIEAVTSFDALEYVNHIQAELLRAAAIIKAQPAELAERAEALQRRVQELEGELKKRRLDAAGDHIDALVAQAEEVKGTRGVEGAASAGTDAANPSAANPNASAADTNASAADTAAARAGYRLVVARLDGHAVEGLRGMWDLLRARLGEESAVVLGSLTPAGTPLLLAAATPAAVACGFDAGAVIKAVAPLIKGGGGGKPTMAQAGGKAVEGIDFALRDAHAMLIG